LDSQILKVFANNEVGFAFDPNDFTTLYQDVNGTIPVTDVGQPVGLLLDKSKGLTLGTELKQSALAKLIGTAPVATFNTVTGVGTVNRVDIVNQSFIVFNDTVGKKWYKVSITNTSATASISLRNASFTSGDTTLATIAPSTTFTGYVYVASGFLLGIAASTGDCGFTVNSIKEIAGNHAYQANSSSRPIVQRNSTTSVGYLAFDGVDDFLQTNNINFTTTDKMSLFAGVRKLSDAAASIVAELSADANTAVGSFYLAAPSATNTTVSFYSKGLTGTRFITASNLAAPLSFVASCTFDMRVDSKLRVNSKLRTSSNISMTGTGLGNYPLYIGNRGGTSLPFNGQLYSLIGVGKISSYIDTVFMEQVLAKQTGVTLSV
jgi:hypothetical protein